MRIHLKIFIAAVILNLMLGQPVRASVKYYQYNGNLPFVEMMLNMMVVMGILDKIPTQMMGNNYYGANNYNGTYGQQNYLKNWLLQKALLNRQGMGLSGFNPYGLNSTGFNPMSMGGGATPLTLNPVISNPLALNSVGFFNPPGLYMGSYPAGNALGLAGSGFRPWYSSSLSRSPWDNILLGSYPASNYTDEPYYDESYYDEYPVHGTGLSRSPLRRYIESGWRHRSRHRYSPLARHYQHRYRSGHRPDRHAISSANSPCVTEFCGMLNPPVQPVLMLPRLDGLWVTQSGEMLGIKNNRFLWSDGSSRYLTGKIRVLPGRLIILADGRENQPRQYQYRLQANRLLTQDAGNVVRVFMRVPVN